MINSAVYMCAASRLYRVVYMSAGACRTRLGFGPFHLRMKYVNGVSRSYTCPWCSRGWIHAPSGVTMRQRPALTSLRCDGAAVGAARAQTFPHKGAAILNISLAVWRNTMFCRRHADRIYLGHKRNRNPFSVCLPSTFCFTI